MIYNQSLSPQLKSPHILWDSILTRATLTATSEAATGLVANMADAATNRAWSCVTAGGTATAVLALAETCDMVGFAAHTLMGRTVSVQYWTGAVWVAVATVTPDSNDAFMVSFQPRSSTQWRIVVTGAAFTIGVCYLGAALVVPGTIQPPHTPLNFCETVELGPGWQSVSGQFLGADVSIFAGTANLRFEVQQPQFVISSFEAFRRWFNRAGSFFVACAPNAWPLDMGYCRRNGSEIVPPFRDAVFMDLGMEVAVYRG